MLMLPLFAELRMLRELFTRMPIIFLQRYAATDAASCHYAHALWR